MASARWSGYYNRGPYRLLYTIQETLETPFRYGTPYFEKATPIAAAHSNQLPSRDVDAVNQTRYPCQDCRINYPSEEKLANHLTKSSHKEKVESNNSKGKARG
ncbi:hypothetical protein MJO29_011840 [Puccinia striiformis f. sp. tritici]|nr:hypothetical protein Pst134EB_023411 [Puccinia striiformis f. sp. tritici]KAI7945452.1 hypothetical protein MJO29_011840 [Puccinia striiformis f. sp. tritici]KAI9611193.1 hypothetical protein KEM48_004665 [Puccinia striiformis f. sp. tritici PST-130]